MILVCSNTLLPLLCELYLRIAKIFGNMELRLGTFLALPRLALIYSPHFRKLSQGASAAVSYACSTKQHSTAPWGTGICGAESGPGN